MTDPAERDPGVTRARRRLRGLVIHFLGYFVVMAALFAVNLSSSPETPWFVWPVVGWGGMLAIHTAWAMGLFDILGSGRQRHPGTDQ